MCLFVDYVKKGFRAELPIVVEFQSFEIDIAGEMLVVGESTIASVKTSVRGNAGCVDVLLSSFSGSELPMLYPFIYQLITCMSV